MGVYSIKPAFQRSLLPLEDALVARNVHPDVITLSALGLSTAGGAAVAFSAPGHRAGGKRAAGESRRGSC